jgi:beta-glucosidase
MQGGDLVVSGVVTNTGNVAGKAVAQVYLAPRDWKAFGWEAPKRLVAFQKIDLAPGASAPFTQHVDGRLTATYNTGPGAWVVAEGSYRVELGLASDDLPQKTDVTLHGTTWGAAKQ